MRIFSALGFIRFQKIDLDSFKKQRVMNEQMSQ